MTTTSEDTTRALAEGAEFDAERMQPALRAAERIVRLETAASVEDQAIDDFRSALVAVGAAILTGVDPQTLEDVLVSTRPESPLREQTLRRAWLALVDDLGRTGEKPAFGSGGAAESWAFTACSRPWPFVDLEEQVAPVAALFGGPQRVVIVRGPGRTAFLAAVRRRLLAEHGVDAMVPPVMPAARDDITSLLRPYVERSPLPDEIRGALGNLGYGEDFVGLLGRAGETESVALILDDAHLQSRSVLMGLTLFMEPGDARKALLILAAPGETREDGVLAEVITDAREREILVEVTLPSVEVPLVNALLAARFDADPPADWIRPLVTSSAPFERASDRLRWVNGWLDALTTATGPASDGAAQLEAGYSLEERLPTHAEAVRALSVAATEGGAFHAFALGRALGKDEDFVEDLLHDDEFELEGELVGTCEEIVPSDSRSWASAPDGLHPVFSFSDPRIPLALVARTPVPERSRNARAMRDALLEGYGPEGIWQIIDTLWALSGMANDRRNVQQWLLAARDPGRIEAGFRRLLPILSADSPYRLAVSRLYGAAMEMGGVATVTGRVNLADQAYQAAAVAAEKMGRPGAAGEALARLAEVRLALALPEPAHAALGLAEALMKKAGHEGSLARIELLRGEVFLLQGAVDDALAAFTTGVETLRVKNDGGHLALGLVRLGRILYERDEKERGLALLDEAVVEADKTRDPRPAGAARLARAKAYADQNQINAAFPLLQQAAAMFQRAGMPIQIVEVAAADLQRRNGDPAAAQGRLQVVADAFKKANAAVQWADASFIQGQCLLDQEKYTEAARMFEEVRQVRVRARDRFSLVETYELLGEALLGQGNPSGALIALAQGRCFAERLGQMGRMGRLDGAMASLVGALDADSSIDAAQAKAQAQAEVEGMEATWNAPPQPRESSQEVH